MLISFDPNQFDQIVRGSLPDCGEEHLGVLVKENATPGGHPAACITFVSMTENGPRRVQIVVTVRLLLNVLVALRGKFAYLEEPMELPAKSPLQLSGHFAGVGWNAVIVDRVYLVAVEGNPIGLAKSEAEARAVAEGTIKALLASGGGTV